MTFCVTKGRSVAFNGKSPTMKLFRVLLCVVGGLAAILLIVGLLAFVPAVQTWAARKAAATQPGVSIGRVAVGLRSIEAREVHVDQPGLRMRLPSADVEIGLLSALQQRIEVGRLVAKGWTIEVTEATPTAGPATAGKPSPSLSPQPTGAPPSDALASPPPVLQSLFDLLQLPVDLAIAAVDLEGDIVVRGQPGVGTSRMHVVVTGGDLQPDREGHFTIVADITSDDPSAPVAAMKATAKITAQMATPRTFRSLLTEVELVARGTPFPDGATLQAKLAAHREPTGERYELALHSSSKELLRIAGALPADQGAFDGTWTVSLSNVDLAPFALGRPLPTFTAKGGGELYANRSLTEVRAAGKLDVDAARLEVLRSGLEAVGSLRLHTVFDVVQRESVLEIVTAAVDVAGERPIVSVSTLQPIRFDTATKAFAATEPSVALAKVRLEGLPLAWVGAFAPGLAVTGEDLHGEFIARLRDRGLAVEVSEPLEAMLASVEQDGRSLVAGVSWRLAGASFFYSPTGWQADLGEMRLAQTADGVALFSLKARAAQPGADPAMKAQGEWTADVAALLRQPVFADAPEFSHGVAKGAFAAAVDEKQALQATVTVGPLTLKTGETLPTMTAEVRADIAADGRISWSAPLTFVNASAGGRKSDLAIEGELTPGQPQSRIVAVVASETLYIEDIKLLTAAIPPTPPEDTTRPKPDEPDGEQGPPWDGYVGELKLSLKKVVYSPELEVTGIEGTIALTPESVSLESLRAALSGGGSFQAGGGVNFRAGSTEPYALKATMALTNFDPAPVFRTMDKTAVPPVEGRFDMTGKVTGASADLETLGAAALGDMKLVSRGGTLRALSVNVQNYTKVGSSLAGIVGLVSRARGDEKTAVYADRTQALASIAQELAVIRFDQLNLEVSRAAGDNYAIKDITLISPTVRLAGTGNIVYQPGVSLLKSPLNLTLQIGGRDRLANNLKVLRLTSDTTDDLGYFSLKDPVQIDGTLSAVGTEKLKSLLVGAMGRE